jgi:hypothetical protein
MKFERYAKVITAIQAGDDLSISTSPLQLSKFEMKAAQDVLRGDVYHLLPKVRKYVLLSDGFSYYYMISSSGKGYGVAVPRETFASHFIPLNPID